MGVNMRLRPVARLLVLTISSVLGWLVVVPLAWLIPKRPDWIAVIGRDEGQFLDNAKYFFLQARALEPNLRIVFITRQANVQTLLFKSTYETLRYPTVRSVWYLLRCNLLVADESGWFRHMRFFLLIRARVVQLWHGVPFKRIELDRWQHETGAHAWASNPAVLRIRLLGYRITGRWTRYAAVVCTSRIYRDEAFHRAFRASHFPIVGYPRNDFALSLNGEGREIAWANVDTAVRTKLQDWQRLGHRMVLVAPTFRDSGTLPMQLGPETLQAIDAFAQAHGVEFVFKFHPSERNADRVNGKHFHVCARDSDIYPLLPYFAALVTDYSSIGMDFLLVDRPLLFLIPDDDEYTQKDRQLQFDPRTMMPGLIVPDWTSLLDALLNEWANDTHAGERATLRRRAFDDLPQSEAVPKLLAFMREQSWIKDAPARDTL
jgi:CDP-glycerol glycerophosphotransferase (TagB/SpsB family)